MAGGGKHIVLGVAFDWDRRKGIDIFAVLSGRLGKDYQIVLVGVDEKAQKEVPEDIITIQRTKNQKELAEIYSAADVFVNPTRDEVLGMVNIEAQACGTPVITFDSGGSPECICEKTGFVINCGDIDDLTNKIQYICEGHPFDEEKCIHQADCFASSKKYLEYIKIYKGVLHWKKNL